MSKRLVVVASLAVAFFVAQGALAGPQAAAPVVAQAAVKPALAHVVVLATGGTIAGVQPKEGEPG
jgi:L-asparaginase/Glu-tRNA(Gln) amidotransferase subunit D